MATEKQLEEAPTKEIQSVPDSEMSSNSSSEALLKAAHRKVDKRLLCWYAFVYLIMRIHVSNISNTAIMNLEQGTGIKKQLGHLSSSQWAWALSIFYYPYMFLEPLATLMLKHFSPNVWMSRIMITWGIISMCQGATQNYAGILTCRFFLGAAEAGFYPGVLYHLSFWYPTDRLPLRIAFFYACGMFSGTISGLLAYAISFMNGVAGLAGWRWVCSYRTHRCTDVLMIYSSSSWKEFQPYCARSTLSSTYQTTLKPSVFFPRKRERLSSPICQSRHPLCAQRRLISNRSRLCSKAQHSSRF
jgi:MFS family permease